MSVRLYFGLPGSGKTTLMSAIALEGCKKPNFNVYCNVPLNIPKVIPITNDMVGKFNLHDGLILIDEATIFADSRKFKSFSDDLVKLFVMHRHFKVDIYLFLQNYSRTDLTIRMLADKVFWVRKLGPISMAVEIPMDVFIPKKDVSDNNGTAGEIVNGYYRPPIWSYIFAKKIWRKKYYPYFDSFNTYHLPELPDELLKHNPETCPQTNPDYEMDARKVKLLIKHFEDMDLPSPDEQLVDVNGEIQADFGQIPQETPEDPLPNLFYRQLEEESNPSRKKANKSVKRK